MINLKEIEDEIIRLEHSDTNYSTCEKLSILYTVRNELTSVNNIDERELYSYAPAPSEFIETFNRVPIEKALEVIDNHMEAMKIVYPQEYKKIIDKLNDSL